MMVMNVQTQQGTKGTGSGVVYNVSNDAVYIVTNNHVIEGAKEIKVSLYDGETVTQGIISAVNRTISVNTSAGDWELEVIQTDAAINPGNSGGNGCFMLGLEH